MTNYFFPRRQPLSDEQVLASFQDPGRALEIAMKERSLEVDIYWRRNTFFWTLVAAALAGYVLLSTPSGGDIKRFAELKLVVACVGAVFSYSWTLVTAGSGYWQEHWWRMIQVLEHTIVGPLHSVKLERTAVSVTWVNKILCGFMTAMWVALVVAAFNETGLALTGEQLAFGGVVILLSIAAAFLVTVLSFRRRDGRRFITRGPRSFRRSLFRAVIVGSATIDDQIIGTHRTRQIGGVPTYAGRAYSRSRIDVLAITRLSDELRPDVIGRLNALSIKTRIFPAATCTTFENKILSDDRRLQRILSVAPPISADALVGVECELLHLGPLHGKDLTQDVYSYAASEQFTHVALDVQGLVRARVEDSIRPGVQPHLADALQATDYLKADEAEWRLILDHLSIGEQKLLKDYGIAEVVVSDGSNGGRVLRQGERDSEYRAHPVKTVKDTTGAGDVFFSTYLVARVRDGEDVQKACRRAARAAAKQVSGTYITAKSLAIAPLQDSPAAASESGDVS